MSDSMRFLPVLGRLLIVLLFLPSGFEKLTQFQGSVVYAAAHGLPLPAVAVGIALIIELGGSLLLVIGYRARWVAAAIAFYSIVAAFGFHTNFSIPDEQIHFLKDLAIAGGLLQIAYFGAGPFSIDNRG